MEPLSTVVQPMSPSPAAASHTSHAPDVPLSRSHLLTQASPRPLSSDAPAPLMPGGSSSLVGSEATTAMLSQQNKALQGLLSRAEENLLRATDREKQLRQQLEGQDVPQMIAGQQTQMETLAHENKMLKQQVKTLEALSIDQQHVTNQLERSLSEAIKGSESADTRLSAKLAEKEKELEGLKGEVVELRKWEAEARRDCEEVLREKAAMRGHIQGLEDSAAERERVMAKLEWTVGDLTKQLECASGDIDLASQMQDRNLGEISQTKNLLEGLKAELRDSQAAHASARREIQQLDHAMQQLRSDSVGKDVADKMRSDLLVKCKELQGQKDQCLVRMAALEAEVSDQQNARNGLQQQLREAEGMWSSTASENEALRGRLDAVGRECEALVADGEALRARIASLAEANQVLEDRVIQMKRFEDGYQQMEERHRKMEEDACASKKAFDQAKVQESVAEAKMRNAQAEALAAQQRLDEANRTLVPGVEVEREIENANEARKEGALERASLRQRLLEATKALGYLTSHTAEGSRARIQVFEQVARELRDVDATIVQACLEAPPSPPLASDTGRAALLDVQHQTVAAELRRVEGSVAACEGVLELSLAAIQAWVALKEMDSGGSKKEGAPPALRGLFRTLEGEEGGREGAVVIGELERELLVMRTESVPMAEYKKAIAVLHAEREKERESERQRQRLTDALRKAQSDAEHYMHRAVQGEAGTGELQRVVNQLSEMRGQVARLDEELRATGRERDDARRAHMEVQARLNSSEAERQKMMAEMERINSDRVKLKEAVKTATEAIRQVADHRSEKVQTLERRVSELQRERETLVGSLMEAEGGMRAAAEARERERMLVDADLERSGQEKEALRNLTVKLQSSSVPIERMQEAEGKLRASEMERDRVERTVAGLEAAVKARDERLATLEEEVQEMTAAMRIARELYGEQQQRAEQLEQASRPQPPRNQSSMVRSASAAPTHRALEALQDQGEGGGGGRAPVTGGLARVASSPVLARVASSPVQSKLAERVMRKGGGLRGGLGESWKGSLGGGLTGLGGVPLADMNEGDDGDPSSAPEPTKAMSAGTPMRAESTPLRLGKQPVAAASNESDGLARRTRSANPSGREQEEEDEYVRRSALKSKWWKNKQLKTPTASAEKGDGGSSFGASAPTGGLAV